MPQTNRHASAPPSAPGAQPPSSANLSSTPEEAGRTRAPEGKPGADPTRRALYWLITLCGLAAGVGVTATQMRLTDFPIDMIIYREGVQAFFSGREVYGEPMMAGDIALPFIYPPFGAVALAPLAPAAISHAIAGDVMIAISGGLMLACLYVVLRAIIRGRDRPWLLPLTAAAWPAAM